MTSCGPYSLATITYEPRDSFFVPVIDEKSILGVLFKNFLPVYSTVKKAGLEKMYATSYLVTLFVDEKLFDGITSTNEAVELCRAYTCPRRIDDIALKTSKCLVLKTMASPFDILIENYGKTANGKKITETIFCSNGIIHVLSE